jgi:hypothetical protein
MLQPLMIPQKNEAYHKPLVGKRTASFAVMKLFDRGGGEHIRIF